MNTNGVFVCCVGVLVICMTVGAFPGGGSGDPCSTDGDCLFSMKCSGKKCVCKEGYFLNKQSCLGGIGSICNYDDDCIVDSLCKNRRTCECDEGMQESEDGSKCIGEVARITDSTCEENFDCEQYGEAFCEKKVNQCQCRVDGHLREGRCWRSRGLREQCFSSEECYSAKNRDSMVCHQTNHTCVCKDGTHLSEDGNICQGAAGRAGVNLTSLIALLASYVVAKILSS